MRWLPRAALLVAGVAAAAYGVMRLLDLGQDNTRSTLVWLVGGVVLHDGVFAPAVLVVSIVAVRPARRELLAPAVVILVVLVPVTLLGIPELGRLGARADRPTLLDRDYWLGWSALVTLVVACVLVAGPGLRGVRRRVVRADRAVRADRGGGDGEGDGRR